MDSTHSLIVLLCSIKILLKYIAHNEVHSLHVVTKKYKQNDLNQGPSSQRHIVTRINKITKQRIELISIQMNKQTTLINLLNRVRQGLLKLLISDHPHV